MTAPPLRPGRVPFRIYLLVACVAIATLLAAVAGAVSWYSESGTLEQPDYALTSTTHFLPGFEGSMNECTLFFSSNTTICGLVAYQYNSSSGSGLLVGLWWGVLGVAVGAAACGLAGAIALSSYFSGRIRTARARRWLLVFLTAGICVALAGAIALPILQPVALQQAGYCDGFDVPTSPCTSFAGQVAGVGCSGGSCLETGVSWHPEAGWYLALAAAILFGIALVIVRFRPLGKVCPRCGGQTRYSARFCDTCSAPLPP